MATRPAWNVAATSEIALPRNSSTFFGSSVACSGDMMVLLWPIGRLVGFEMALDERVDPLPMGDGAPVAPPVDLGRPHARQDLRQQPRHPSRGGGRIRAGEAEGRHVERSERGQL